MLGSKSKVMVKVMGQGPRLKSNFWGTAVYIRGLALPSAVKSNESHCQSKVLVGMSVISRCMWIIVQMWSAFNL